MRHPAGRRRWLSPYDAPERWRRASYSSASACSTASLTPARASVGNLSMICAIAPDRANGGYIDCPSSISGRPSACHRWSAVWGVSRAALSLAQSKLSTSGIVAEMIVAVSIPTLGIVARRWLVLSCAWSPRSRASAARAACPSQPADRKASLQVFGPLLRALGRDDAEPVMWARIALPICVRWLWRNGMPGAGANAINRDGVLQAQGPAQKGLSQIIDELMTIRFRDRRISPGLVVSAPVSPIVDGVRLGGILSALAGAKC